MGHPVDKVELIVMGGTFLAYPVDYQYDFVKRTVKKNRTDVAEEIRCSPRPPSALLVEAVRIVEANALLGQRPWEGFLQEGLVRLGWARPDESTDVLVDPRDGKTVLEHPTQEMRTSGQPLVFLGPTAGYLLAFPAAAWIADWRPWSRRKSPRAC